MNRNMIPGRGRCRVCGRITPAQVALQWGLAKGSPRPLQLVELFVVPSILRPVLIVPLSSGCVRLCSDGTFAVRTFLAI